MMKATASPFGLLAALMLLGGCAQLSVERVHTSPGSLQPGSLQDVAPAASAALSPETPGWTWAERYQRYPSFHPLRRVGSRPEPNQMDEVANDESAMTSAVTGDDDSLRDPAPLLEQDLIAVGYASITAQRSSDPAQQRLMAARASRLDAYRNLAEQVYGLTVLAETSVNNDVLRDDRLRAQLMGFISGAELVAMEPLGNDTYQTTLRLSAAQVASLRAQVR